MKSGASLEFTSEFTGQSSVACWSLDHSLAQGVGLPLSLSDTLCGQQFPRLFCYYLVRKGQHRNQRAELFPASRTGRIICETHCKMKVRGPLFKSFEKFHDGGSAFNQSPGPSEHGVLRACRAHVPTKPALTLACCLLPMVFNCLLQCLPLKSEDQSLLFVTVSSGLLSMPGL